jgi:molybdopterin-guanine dinucleotide biosynthesis protein A
MIKPKGGKFHRNELALIGAPCDTIQMLAQKINAALEKISMAYVDADHGQSDDPPIFSSTYTDKIGFHQLHFRSDYLDYEFRHYLDHTDMVLVNGNHFTAENQIVIINESKKESLKRKLDRLTNVQMFILDEGSTEIFDYLLSENEKWQTTDTFRIDQIDEITDKIDLWFESSKPVLNGMVLAGGKSTRMGKDKSQIEYHGKPHSIYLAHLLSEYCHETFLSKAQKENEIEGFTVLADSFTDLGPYGGILSAFRSNPNAAWMTIATDIPMLDRDTIKTLVENRNTSKFATCFHNPETNFPEPLITIWEPRMYPRLLQFLAQGYSCPRKALINSDIEEIHLSSTEVLGNANTPEEMQAYLAKLNG